MAQVSEIAGIGVRVVVGDDIQIRIVRCGGHGPIVAGLA
jgi:hypothetical protein